MTEMIEVYIGTYTQPIIFGTGQILEGKGRGIYRLSLNLRTGMLEQISEVTEAVNPSYLTLNSTGSFLYAVNELKEYNGQACGAVSAYRVNRKKGILEYMNTMATGGTDPCHVTMNSRNSHIYVSNFMSGSICVFPLQSDGSIGSPVQFIQHAGSSVNRLRQTSPHAHSLIFDINNQYAFVPDLGIDKLMIYSVDSNNGTLSANDPPWYSVSPGAGPRHCVFDNSGRYCYLINELDSTISVLSYNSQEGSFTQLQTVPSLAEPFEGENTCADVHIAPDGRFLYGSNRGHNSIVIYRINDKSGYLDYAGMSPSGGRTPRNFAIDPTGTCILVCNQDTDNISVFEINKDTGTLILKSEFYIPTPVCAKFCIH